MAIANGTCVSFCNQPKAHYLATSRESCRYVVAVSRSAGAGIWLRQESLRHILASPGYTPGTIAVNVTRIERGFNAGQKPRSIPIFNRLRAIAIYWLEIATFSYPLAFNASVGRVPIGIPGKRLDRRKLKSRGYQAKRQFDDRLSRFDTIPAYARGYGKSYDQYLAIARKRFKMDGYMLRCVWRALNPLSIRVTFTAIVPGAYPGEAKMC